MIKKFTIYNLQFTIKALLIIFMLYIVHFTLYIPAYAQQATLSLSPSSGTFNKGCAFSLKMDLDTGGVQTDGTDAILIYDPSRLTATSIVSGSIYQDYPGNNIDEAKGEITVSGLASVSTPFSGQGTLATINFTVKSDAPEGVTQIKFDFDPNDKAKTIDSNVVERGTIADTLNSVVNGNYTIGSGSCGTTIIVGQGAVSTPSATTVPVKTLPPAGSERLTYTLAIVGSVFVILGILGLALL